MVDGGVGYRFGKEKGMVEVKGGDLLNRMKGKRKVGKGGEDVEMNRKR